jgi:multidrug efflux pump
VLTDVATDQLNGGLKTNLTIDRDTASRLGILPQAIDNTLYDAFGQRLVSTIFTQLNQYHVVLEVLPNFATSPDAVNNVYIRPSSTIPNSGAPTANAATAATSGTPVPISTFTKMQSVSTPLAVNHQGQFPVVTLSFNLAPGASLGEATKAIQQAEKDIQLPASIHASFQGTAAAFQNSLASEPFLILAAVITVYIVLGVLYESYIHPITILSTLPSAGVGAILALMLTGNDLTVVALIGIILLIGIVKKNAIMQIDFALEAERKEGKTPLEAIYEGCLIRFRPIMMTTMAALLGALPVALGYGAGGESRRPLGLAVVGGLLFSQLITLYLTPVVYTYMASVLEWTRRRKHQAASFPAPHGAPVGAD